MPTNAGFYFKDEYLGHKVFDCEPESMKRLLKAKTEKDFLKAVKKIKRETGLWWCETPVELRDLMYIYRWDGDGKQTTYYSFCRGPFSLKQPDRIDLKLAERKAEYTVSELMREKEKSKIYITGKF